MAKSKVTTTTVMVPKEEKTITLTLNTQEAFVLRYILGNIGGCPVSSLRKISDQIEEALEEVVEFYVPPKEGTLSYVDNSFDRAAFYFKENEGMDLDYEEYLK